MRFILDQKARENSLGCWPKMSDQDILEAANSSAIYSTHPIATHRFEDILFTIEDGVIVGAYVEAKLAKHVMKDICPDCQDDGGYCVTCNSTGGTQYTVGELVENMKREKVKEDQRVKSYYRKIQGAERLHRVSR
jgi:hypothetical protein